MAYAQIIAEAFSVREDYVENIISLLDEGNPIPFIARYRKEMTKGLDEEQIRTIQEVYEYEK